jgi:hypothetical protein
MGWPPFVLHCNKVTTCSASVSVRRGFSFSLLHLAPVVLWVTASMTPAPADRERYYPCTTTQHTTRSANRDEQWRGQKTLSQAVCDAVGNAVRRGKALGSCRGASLWSAAPGIPHRRSCAWLSRSSGFQASLEPAAQLDPPNPTTKGPHPRATSGRCVAGWDRGWLCRVGGTTAWRRFRGSGVVFPACGAILTLSPRRAAGLPD